MNNDELKEFNSKDIIEEKIDMKKFIDELVKTLRSDNDVYESLKPFNLTYKDVKENIGKLADYQQDFNICKKCPGFDKCPKENKHISMYVFKDGSYLTTRSEPCKKMIEEMKIESRYLVRDFPEEWKKITPKKIKTMDDRLELINDFLGGIMKNKSRKWLYVKGNSRVGKSYILVAFANEFAKKKGQVAIINASKRFKDLADIVFSDKERFRKAFEMLCNVPLLVIDDFGEEYKTELVRDQIIIPLLTERARKNRLTFFSSAFTIQQIQQLYSTGKSGAYIRAKQLCSILTSMCGNEYDITGVPDLFN